MKRFCILILTLLLTLALAGCGEKGPEYAFDRYGNEYTIDREQGTISDGTYTYGYTYDGDSEVFSISIEYPNGSHYSYNQSNGFGTGSHSSTYDEKTYARGDVLAEVLQEYAPKKGSARKILAALVLAGGGIFCIACPEAVWYLESGWRYKDAEPSDAALLFARLSGVVALIIGIIVVLC